MPPTESEYMLDGITDALVEHRLDLFTASELRRLWRGIRNDPEAAALREELAWAGWRRGEDVAA